MSILNLSVSVSENNLVYSCIEPNEKKWVGQVIQIPTLDHFEMFKQKIAEVRKKWSFLQIGLNEFYLKTMKALKDADGVSKEILDHLCKEILNGVERKSGSGVGFPGSIGRTYIVARYNAQINTGASNRNRYSHLIPG